LLGDKNKGGIVLVDVPGVGEDPQRHKEYVELYKSLVPNLDLVLWAVKADDRKYLSAIDVYNEVLLPNIKKCPVVFVITQVDKIEPHREWDMSNNIPSPKQQANIMAKANDISARFDVSTNKVIAVSSSDGYNLVELVNRVVEVLPNEKKYSFAREAKEENVSDEAAKSAEKGVLDHGKYRTSTRKIGHPPLKIPASMFFLAK
jgi:predicted GTPase